MGVDTGVRDAQFIAADNRSNFKQVVAKRSDLLRLDGGRLAPSLYGTTQNAGLVLGYATSGGDSGFWKAYNDLNTDGSQTAAGVLYAETTVDVAGNGSEIQIIKAGVLCQDLLIGLDAAGIVDLKGNHSVEHGVNLLAIYA